MQKDIRQLHETFLDQCRYAGQLRPETIRGYKASFDLLLKIIPDIALNDLNPETMTEFFKRLSVRKRTVGSKGVIKQGIKSNTVATYRNKLNKFFKWLQQHHYIEKDPFFGLPYPDVKYTDRKFLRKEAVEKIFAGLTFSIDWSNSFVKRRNTAMYTVLLYCGLRAGELIALKVQDIDFDHNELRVHAETSKSKIDRYVPMNSKVVTVLNEYREERRKRGYQTQYLWASDTKDDRLSRHGLKHLQAKMVRDSGVRFHLHQFRHTFAVNMLNSGCDIYKLKQLLGHSDIRMTCAYLRCLPTKAMREDVEKLSFDKLL